MQKPTTTSIRIGRRGKTDGSKAPRGRGEQRNVRRGQKAAVSAGTAHRILNGDATGRQRRQVRKMEDPNDDNVIRRREAFVQEMRQRAAVPSVRPPPPPLP
jgi:hypothetical protein